MSSKTEPASEAKEHECEFFLDNESVVYFCECGDIDISGKTYYPEDKVNLLKEEITRLKAELERERELRINLTGCIQTLMLNPRFRAEFKNTSSVFGALLEKAKN